MKVILSRKGFDSTYGGYPSIILPNKEIIMIPIPSNDNITYSMINTNFGNSLYDVMKKLNSKVKVDGKFENLTMNTRCHLDPDLVENSIERIDGWRGCFGQIGAAQRVLENNNVKEGDLFIFFGWFNDIEETSKGYSFKKGKDRHIMFGYLQVDKIIHTEKDIIPNWLMMHPHVNSSRFYKPSNCIYVAKERCTFNQDIKGYGVFKYSEELDLTKKGMSRSCWNLPNIFKGLNITYHSQDSWKDGYFKSACRGQEFVIEENEKIEKWAINLVEKYSNNKIDKKLIKKELTNI